MRSRILTIAALVVVAYGCRTTTPPPAAVPDTLGGVASWYGEEFAGRTTANGEIFDPTLLTAAHRTLPFGTIVDVTNPQTQQTVRVRVNDRGPYIGNRVIDLSYAAAQQIGLIEPGVGEVKMKIVRLGNGEREPPMPLEVTIAQAAPNVPPVAPSGNAPEVAFPLPQEVNAPATVERVDVETQRGGVMTRRQVAVNGTTIEEVPIAGAAPLPATPGRSEAAQLDRTTPRPAVARPVNPGDYVVQVGAFAVEANAKSLQEKLASIGQQSFIAHDDLYRVRIGPFASRQQALDARSALEAHGLSAMVVQQ